MTIIKSQWSATTLSESVILTGMMPSPSDLTSLAAKSAPGRKVCTDTHQQAHTYTLHTLECSPNTQLHAYIAPFLVTSKPFFFFFFKHTLHLLGRLFREVAQWITQHHRDLKKCTRANCYAIWTNLAGHPSPCSPPLPFPSSPPWPHWSPGMPLCKSGLSRFPLAFIFIRDVFVLAQPPGTT